MTLDEREQQAASLAAQLPEARGALLDAAAEALEAFNTAVMAGDEAAALAAMDRKRAAVWKLNGGTLFGCEASEGAAGCVVARYCAAPPGEVPRWGRQGEFLLTVAGMRAVVEYQWFCGMHHFSFHAVDLEAPFLSDSGYRSHFLLQDPAGLEPPPAAQVSRSNPTVDSVAAHVMAELIEEQGRKPIREASRQFLAGRPLRPWLAELPPPAPEAGQYQERDGQLAFGF